MANISIIIHLALSLWLCCHLSTADLADDILEFKELIPRRQINGIVAKHYFLDRRFRIAINYVRSGEFADTVEDIFQVPGIQPLREYMEKHTDGQDLTPVLKELTEVFENYRVSRGIDFPDSDEVVSFRREVLNAFPRSKIHSLISLKVRKSPPFDKFYRALRAPKFKELVKSARNVPRVKKYIKELSSNHIDIDEIIKAVFEVISWGPKISTTERRRSRRRL